MKLYSRVLTLFISRFSTSRISCSDLKFKPEPEETFDDLKKSFESFSEQDPSGRPQSQTQQTSKLAPNDDSQYVLLINLEP
jgi:hypothetical protein